eukprot:scaffold204482_cov35-Prasinocladus_malaysianus.AAC.1
MAGSAMRMPLIVDTSYIIRRVIVYMLPVSVIDTVGRPCSPGGSVETGRCWLRLRGQTRRWRGLELLWPPTAVQGSIICEESVALTTTMRVAMDDGWDGMVVSDGVINVHNEVAAWRR